mgnify:CR=1 FL=1
MIHLRYILLITFPISISLAQENLIMGRVTDKNGAVLPNVNIVSKPSNSGTQTNHSGEFTFIPADNDSLCIFKHIGFETDSIRMRKFENYTVVVLTQKVLEFDRLDVTGQSRRQFDEFETKNNVISINTEELSVRGFTDLGDALFSEQSVVMNENMNGEKFVSVRASSPEEMIFLYDGVRINIMGDPMLDLSIFSFSGLSGMELVKGSHETAMASSGTINFIPKLTYGPSATFTQQFGTYNYGGYDGFGSVGNSSISVNGGTGQSQLSQIYVDAEKPEIITGLNRQFIHFGMKKGQKLEFRGMAFQNEKQFQNDRTENSLSLNLQNMIGKIIYEGPMGESITLHGLYQKNTGVESTTPAKIDKEGESFGYGFSYQKPIRNATIKLWGETSALTSNWERDSMTFLIDQYNSLITGSLELINPDLDRDFQLKDVKIVLNRQIVSDAPGAGSTENTSDENWQEASSLFTTSFLSIQKENRVLIYTNVGNVYRFPSVSEMISNQIHSATSFSLGLLPEHKSTYEAGLKVEKISIDNSGYFSIGISGFNYHYTNKIKQIQFSGMPIQFPINFGNVSLSGFDSHLSLRSVHEHIQFSSYYSLYHFSDPIAFQLQPEKMLRNKLIVTGSGFTLMLIHRKESSRQLTTIEESGEYFQNRLIPINTFDISLSFIITLKDYKATISLSGKNLMNDSQELNGISLFDRRINLGFGLSWK